MALALVELVKDASGNCVCLLATVTTNWHLQLLEECKEASGGTVSYYNCNY